MRSDFSLKIPQLPSGRAGPNHESEETVRELRAGAERFRNVISVLATPFIPPPRPQHNSGVPPRKVGRKIGARPCVSVSTRLVPGMEEGGV